MNSRIIAVGAVAFILLGLLLYWQLVITEGAYLGARAVALMYNWVARRYDRLKKFDGGYEALFLRGPLLRSLSGLSEAQVLDVATGTGRVPWLLASSKSFEGRIIGLDYARGMLSEAAVKMEKAGLDGKTTFIWQNAMQLPFPDCSFDLVTCLEALEFMPQPSKVLAEIVRVVRPGSPLILTRRRGWESALMPGKAWSEQKLGSVLDSMEVRRVQFIPWQKDYDLVWGWKPSAGLQKARMPGEITIEALLCCPICAERSLSSESDGLYCTMCNWVFPKAIDGVIELARARSYRANGRGADKRA